MFVSKMKKNKRKGFTLIEMLIVIALIGILAGVVISVINIPKTQARSRDSKRVGDIKRIQTALELYFADNRKYPVSTSWKNVQNILELLPYINPIPVDTGESISNSSQRCYGFTTREYKYGTNSSGGGYVLMATMELTESASPSKCSSIPNCAPSKGFPCSGGASTQYYCYCAQNPM